MEYVQERVTTLHALADPPAVEGLEQTLAETAVVVPMTDREEASLAAEGVLATLEGLSVHSVVVPVRAAPERIAPMRDWLESFDLPVTVLWCNAPAMTDRLAAAGLENGFGKGRDVWLALGVAAERAPFVAVHDADATSYGPHVLRRLVAPLSMEYAFAKGYYARVEEGRLYGRLERLFVQPLLAAAASALEAPVLEYLGAFRYVLAGEVAMTAELARRLRPQPAWGLEVATLGDAHAHVGAGQTAQVDLGRHAHDHRAVAGETGLEGMSREVGRAIARVLETNGLEPDYASLRERYLTVGTRLLEQYAADAAFNGLAHDVDTERGQLERYAEAIAPPGPDRRLPAWRDVDLTAAGIREAAQSHH